MPTDKLAMPFVLEFDQKTYEHLLSCQDVKNRLAHANKPNPRYITTENTIESLVVEALNLLWRETRPLTPTAQAAVERRERASSMAGRGWADGRLPR